MFELMNSHQHSPGDGRHQGPARLCRHARSAANTKIVGTVGYCMSGRYAVNAATHFPDRVKAAASIYGTHLATDQPDSPHLAASKTKAELYFACAETDIYAPQEIIDKVKAGHEGRRTTRSRSIPAPITALPSRSGRSTTATPPSGTGSGCWRSIAATSSADRKVRCKVPMTDIRIRDYRGSDADNLNRIAVAAFEPVSRSLPGLAGDARRPVQDL